MISLIDTFIYRPIPPSISSQVDFVLRQEQTLIIFIFKKIAHYFEMTLIIRRRVNVFFMPFLLHDNIYPREN